MTAGQFTRRGRGRTGPRGYALLVTLILMAVLGAAVTSMFVMQSSAVHATGDMIGTRQAFYACDGITRSMVKLSQAYLAGEDEASIDSNGLMDAVCQGGGMAACTDANRLPLLTPPGFTVTDFRAEVEGEPTTGPLPSGPFEGMNSRQTLVSLHVRAEKDATGHACEAKQEVVLAQIGLFQFFVFAEEFVDVYPQPNMVIDGRVHVNGDFCGHPITGSTYLRVKRLTASGGIYGGSNNCPRSRAAQSRNIHFWDGAGPLDEASSWVAMVPARTHGCGAGACNGGWANYAVSTWGGNVLDTAHGVPNLRLPVSGSPPVQDGLNMDNEVQNNAEGQRFLVDPPLFTSLQGDHPTPIEDALEVRAQKFACKADIRIINGVWYKRDPGDTTCSIWPGTPIWSDHPGAFQITPVQELGLVDDLDVGQVDIGPSPRPRRYSYYAANNVGQLLNGGTFTNSDPRAVISYGRLTGVPGSLRPIDDLLAGTRQGIRDRRVQGSSSGAAAVLQAEILPMNFDIAAFAEALGDTSGGELGSHFVMEPFNGIVWITNTWPGQLNGLANNGDNSASRRTAALWPPPRDGVGPGSGPGLSALPSLTAAYYSDRLPYPLCNDGLSATSAALRPGYPVRPCNGVASSTPSAVRIINGQAIGVVSGGVLDPDILPGGLTIATNLPAYVYGELNRFSDDEPTQWRPVLIAADALTLLSNDFRDSNMLWGSGGGVPAATDTHYRFALIAGDVATADGSNVDMGNWGGGINNFPRFLENWGNSRVAEIYGSMVIGFRSVFHRQRWASTYYTAPVRHWNYDEKFDVISNHPPGAPMYEVQAMKRWSRN